ncbi:hypothetical protein IE81DRAFT_326087 [Ceraceosorus guamensis]|uniref:Uncharacterized protein n=1 Tax=Ceraceosorus guamensis TaxID=1522189 RepID=A0A316VWN4_9BASI|nr:hypothetical protein IE81DRAFT_326087 [Ceraceosorus guamensis]PWN39865.1 hypothetical protein IE81DRAFT_326087 [Ceraceosorus guamensis]
MGSFVPAPTPAPVPAPAPFSGISPSAPLNHTLRALSVKSVYTATFFLGSRDAQAASNVPGAPPLIGPKYSL